MKPKEKALKFPKGFLWGSSTSAYQVEGGIINEWSEWEKKNAGRLAGQAKNYWQPWQIKKFPEILNRENYICGRACDHYNKYKEDFDLLSEFGHNAHRLSLEWSRIEPRPGEFDDKELAHYKEVILDLKKRGIEPFITISHWTNPVWIAAIGGWENKESIAYFSGYVKKVAEEYKDLVKFWQPINEPGTYIGLSYIQGSFPPRVKSFWQANKAFKNIMESYRQSYNIIHGIIKEAQVGMSHYAVYNVPYKNKLKNKIILKPIDYIRNWRFLDSIKNHFDFIGIQYYHTDVLNLKFGLGRWGPIETKNPNRIVSDLGWDIFPRGIYYLLKKASKYEKPIYITENGLADRDDKKREWFIKRHLYWVHRAIHEGVDVRGFFYWSLLDNFEWDKGFWPRFGLVAVDYKTLERKIRPSAWKYAEICKKNGVKI